MIRPTRLTIPRSRLRSCLTCLTCVALAAAPGLAAAQRGAITGEVLDRLAGAPLPFSGVSIAGHPEQLSDAAGRFRMSAVDSGVARIRVRHVGFTPVDTEVVVTPNDTARITIALIRVPVALAAVRVTDQPCDAPGRPGGDDRTLLTIFEQLQLNAEQFRLVNTQYPFETTFAREYGRELETPARGADSAARSDTVELVIRHDAITVRSDRPWRYAPGEVIQLEGIGLLGAQYGVEIPTLPVFTQPDFLTHHCFMDGGEVTVDGQRLRRVDFRAAAAIKTPDIDGSMYLDPTTFVIRRSAISLSKRSSYTESYESVSVETTFDELVPGVPVITLIRGRNVLTSEAGRPTARQKVAPGSRFLSDVEEQRVTRIRFVRGAPGADSARGSRSTVIDLDGQHLHRRVLGVFDAKSGSPLAGVTVRDSATGRSMTTTATGTVNLAFIPRSSAVVEVEHAGYQTARNRVSLTLLDTLPLTVVLQRARAP